jgi:hypothetical protein
MTDTSLAVVIPGPAEGRSPESIYTAREYGFRARRFAAPRNDHLKFNPQIAD